MTNFVRRPVALASNACLLASPLAFLLNHPLPAAALFILGGIGYLLANQAPGPDPQRARQEHPGSFQDLVILDIDEPDIQDHDPQTQTDESYDYADCYFDDCSFF